MKIRTGFVSNSSAASFALPLSILTPDQILQVKDYENVALSMLSPATSSEDFYPYHWNLKPGEEPDEDPDRQGTFYPKGWMIWEGPGFLKGDTSVANFDFEVFLERIGVPNVSFYYKDES